MTLNNSLWLWIIIYDFEYTYVLFDFSFFTQVLQILHSQRTTSHSTQTPCWIIITANITSSSSPPTSHDLMQNVAEPNMRPLAVAETGSLLLLLLAPPTTHYCTFQLAAVFIIFGLMCSGCNSITMGFGYLYGWRLRFSRWGVSQFPSRPSLYFCVFLLYFFVFCGRRLLLVVRSEPISVQAIFVFRIRRSTAPIYNHHQSFGMFTLLVRNKAFM